MTTQQSADAQISDLAVYLRVRERFREACKEHDRIHAEFFRLQAQISELRDHRDRLDSAMRSLFDLLSDEEMLALDRTHAEEMKDPFRDMGQESAS